ERRLDVLVGLCVVSDLHLRSIPFGLALTAERDRSEQDPFGERPGDAEVGAGGVSALRRASPSAIVPWRTREKFRWELVILHSVGRNQASPFAIGTCGDEALLADE